MLYRPFADHAVFREQHRAYSATGNRLLMYFAELTGAVYIGADAFAVDLVPNNEVAVHCISRAELRLCLAWPFRVCHKSLTYCKTALVSAYFKGSMIAIVLRSSVLKSRL
jgi:hypothetical protein